MQKRSLVIPLPPRIWDHEATLHIELWRSEEMALVPLRAGVLRGW